MLTHATLKWTAIRDSQNNLIRSDILRVEYYHLNSVRGMIGNNSRIVFPGSAYFALQLNTVISNYERLGSNTKQNICVLDILDD